MGATGWCTASGTPRTTPSAPQKPRNGRRPALERVDLVFSRDQAQRRYAQDRLREAGGALRQWVADRAVIYVCGSLEGMAPGVDSALREVLGASAFDALVAEGRYRRDVY